MTARFTIGIEEEFQIVDRDTGQLRPHIMTIMEKGVPLFGEQIKPMDYAVTVRQVEEEKGKMSIQQKEKTKTKT